MHAFKHPSAIALYLAVVIACCGNPGANGALIYPASGHLLAETGTVEFWVKPHIDVQALLPSNAQYKGVLNLLEIRGAAGSLQLRWFAGATYAPMAGLALRVTSTAASPQTLLPAVWTPTQATWHHLALSWHGQHAILFLDGDPVASLDLGVPLSEILGDLSSGTISFGDPHGKRNRMAIDDVRLSRLIRLPEELGFYLTLEVDDACLLLDTFETAAPTDGRQRTLPVHSGAGAGGIAPAGAVYLPGKFGQALSLSPPAK